MRVNVVSFVSYRSRQLTPTGARYAVCLIRALKLVGTAKSPKAHKLSRLCRLDTGNVQQALEWFGRMGALIVEIKELSSPVVLVPIPNSDRLRGSLGVSCTFSLAEAIAKELRITAVVSDTLRWNRPQCPAHRGGYRDPETLRRELVLMGAVPGGSVVLVDDVVTSGGHILAAAAKLAGAGVQCSEAICFARTEASGRHAFSVRQITLRGAYWPLKSDARV
jgi:hypothetical protein